MNFFTQDILGMNFGTAQSRESLALALKAKIIALHPDSAVAYIKIPHLDFNYLFSLLKEVYY